MSLVVPVYNVEPYLEDCLASLVGQTLDDIEIICVNDGSTDGSRAILDYWAQRDRRICIIDKQNGGPSSARNVGIEVASSEFIGFPDADDRMPPGACEKIVSMLSKADADVLTFGAICDPPDAADSWLSGVLSPRDAVYDDFSLDLLFKESSRPFAWRTACRTSLLKDKGIRFEEELDLGEDQAFQFALYPRSRRTVLSSKRLYEYRVARAGSLMSVNAGDFAKKMLKHVRVIDCILTDWCRQGLLRAHAPEMVAFALDFAIYDAIKLDDAPYRAVAESLRGVLGRYWSRDEVARMPLSRATKRLADACYTADMGPLLRKKLVLEYYTQQHGMLNTLRHLSHR